jgi:CRISPR-associated protein Csx17
VTLAGCRPEPLASYLKALGVLRLVAEQKDPEALGWWRDEQFVLASAFSAEELVRFFAEEYRPTPIVAPWNKDSGFYKRDSVVGRIEGSQDPRLSEFRQVIAVAREALEDLGWTKEPGKGEEKAVLVAALRSRLPEGSVRWLDTIAALAGDVPTWAPLFVAGGVDGRFEFARVYAESVEAALGVGSGRGGKRRGGGAGLRMALLGTPEIGVAVEATGGLLAPGSVDAPNAAQGFMGKSRVNPWEYVLAVEGAVLLSGAVSRRFGAAGGSRAAFPFTVEPASAGHASAGQEPSRGEVWMPVWERPMTAQELTHLFREGRAEWRGRPATTASDMARAIVALGVDRGLSEFRRYGVQGRHGRSHLAVPLGRWSVVSRPEVELLSELDGFLNELRTAAARRDAPRALTEALRRLDAAILDHAAYGGRERLLQVLLAVTEAELTLASRPGTRPRGSPRPLPGLSGRWVAECDDGTAEFEVAVAVASLRAGERGPGEFRRHLEPVVRRGTAWTWAEGVPHEVVWRGRDCVRDLGAVLERRLVDAEREGADAPLDGRMRAHPAALAALVEGEVDFARLGRLIEALALIDWEGIHWKAEPVTLAQRLRPPVATLPAAYAILKLVFLGRALRVGDTEIELRPDPVILGLLRSGDVWGATVRASRRLRSAGLVVKGIPRDERHPLIARDPELGLRLAAALAVPVREGPLVRSVLELETGEEEGA